MKKLIYSAFILFLVGCNNSAENKEAGDISQEEMEEVIEESPEIEQAKISFQQLFSFYELKDSSHSLQNYQGGTSKLQDTITFPLSKEDIEDFKPLLVFNSDSSKAIDLFSYGYFAIKTPEGYKIEGGEPDSELAIIDLKNNTRQRLLFLGPSYGFTDAKFSNNKIFVTGYEVTDEGKIKPIIWEFDLDQKQMKTMMYENTLNVNINEFLNKRYPGYKFQI